MKCSVVPSQQSRHVYKEIQKQLSDQYGYSKAAHFPKTLQELFQDERKALCSYIFSIRCLITTEASEVYSFREMLI